MPYFVDYSISITYKSDSMNNVQVQGHHPHHPLHKQHNVMVYNFCQMQRFISCLLTKALE